MRDRSLDLGKGIAILCVYLAHSMIYYPIHMCSMYHWCYVLDRILTSFNMPMFFIISGYLFSKTKKSTGELYKGKTVRLLIPYLFTMIVIIGMKLMLPTEISYNKSVEGGLSSMVSNALLYGGDRWFVYILYIIFLLLIPVRTLLKNKWIALVLMITLVIIYFLGFLPKIFALDRVARFMFFFVAGYTLSEWYPRFKAWALNYWWVVYLVAILTNGIFIVSLAKIPFVYLFVLPFIGTLAVMTVAFQLEKVIERSKVAEYIEYCGKYSLQFYLFTFCYPIIRTVIVSVLHVTNPFVILASIFVLQLITITIIVEITRRIKWLKIPCGY